MKLRSNVTNETNQQHDNLLSGYLPIYTALSLADESGHGLLFEGKDNRTRVRRIAKLDLAGGLVAQSVGHQALRPVTLREPVRTSRILASLWEKDVAQACTSLSDHH